MSDYFVREEMLIGKEALEILHNSKVAIFGIGGVGSFVLEGLARSGVGNFVLVDNDVVSESNINRQLIALNSTIGKPKVEVAKQRVLDINPKANVEVYQELFMPDNETISFDNLDYIVDAIDMVTAKIELVIRAKEQNIPIICSMGTGNKLDQSKFEITDIYKTNMDPLSKVMRKELRKRDIKHLKVLYSKEEPINVFAEDENSGKKRVPGSISFVPSVAGLMIAGEVVRDLINKN